MPREMEAEQDAGETSPFAFADEILGYSNRLWKTLLYFSALSAFLVLLVIWLFLGLPTEGSWSLPLYGYAALLIIYFPVSVWNSFRLVLPLKRWMDDYFDFAFVVKFELFPAKGDTPTERFLNKLSEIYPRVSRVRTRKPKAVRQATGFRKNPKVIWDLVIDFNYPGIFHSRFFHQYLGRPWYLVMKRFDTGTPVSVNALKELGESLKQDLRWQNYEISHVFVVSTAGFTPEAVTSVRDDDVAPLTYHPVELVVETARGYELPIKE
jgi:hypothetical protein